MTQKSTNSPTSPQEQTTLPDCPVRHGCTYSHCYKGDGKGKGYFPCGWRYRREDGLFQCTNFEAVPSVALDDVEAKEELFPDHDYRKTINT